MRIRNKIAIVGGIPITIAAAIAVAAWLMLVEAERAREGALMAGAAYRELVGVTTARDDYIGALRGDRAEHAVRFSRLTQRAQNHLDALTAETRDGGHREIVRSTQAALALYTHQMYDLVAITNRNDVLITEMSSRAASLIDLTDRARERQHASNADIIASLTDGDRKLRLSRAIVDGAQELRAAMFAAEIERTAANAGTDEGARRLRFASARLRNAARDLGPLLRADGRSAVADELDEFVSRYEQASAMDAAEPPHALIGAFTAWVDRLIKVNASEQRATHNEVAQLLTYSVAAAETEQATQNIAIATLKLGRRTADALTGRDAAAIATILEESRTLAGRMRALPISPLIQTEMIDAIDGWSARLATTAQGIESQNAVIARMGETAAAMLGGAGNLNDALTSHADRIGKLVRKILALGAAIGLLLGTATAFVVARSITEPLRRLRDDMMKLAQDPSAGVITPPRSQDEFGAMARAVNFFVTEIGRRERALRLAKDEADANLRELRKTQAELIQAEKLASLGQLVAGVAHEINTPLGVALTTSTALEGDVQRLGASAQSGRLLRSELTHTVNRLNEGSRLLFANLTRAADLVQSFKQVAADQASGDRRDFDIREWLHDLLTSLGPVLRKKGHEVSTQCPEGLVVDSYPGALAQVLTNLVMNSLDHGYPDGRAGKISLAVMRTGKDTIRIVYSDDGRGIAPEHRAKIFDPFFTTGRDRGNTGLGLHIIYNLVTAKLQGRIELAGSPERGARFIIDLPLHVEHPAAEPALAAAQ